MKLLRGYSEEYQKNHWVKAEIETTEDDLIPLMASVELPSQALSSLGAYEKFLLMNSETEICLLKQRVFAGVSTEDEIAADLAKFKGIKEQVLSHLKATYVPY